MPSTVYKGDIAEVAFAPEVGLTIVYSTNAVWTATNDGSVTTFTFSSGNAPLFSSANLKYPKNILVGSQVIFQDLNTADNASDGRIFTIVGNDGATLHITPNLGSSYTPAAYDEIHILPYKTPPMDTANHAVPDNTVGSETVTESVLTDQFLGIATAITLPETKVDLKRFHVVGLGRDAAVQVPGKFITEGGSFEVAMHSARWLKYCLGQDILGTVGTSTVKDKLAVASSVGANQVTISTAATWVGAIGKYIVFKNGADVPVVTDHDAVAGSWDGTMSDYDFDKATPHEVRRIIGVDTTTIHLDEPLQYPHTTNANTVQLMDYNDTTWTKAPDIDTVTKTITNMANHLLFSRSSLPSFSLEVSQRRRDQDASAVSDGGQADGKELTRIYRGNKVVDWTLSTDNDGALRLSVNFNSALCYTDTGRIDGFGQNRYNPHRMFDDTASNHVARMKAGIGLGTQKPFMFYNGVIHIAGVQVAQVLSMTLNGKQGTTGYHTINGSDTAATSATSQVPFAGSRNTSVMIEGQTDYDMGLEIIVDDPLFFHKMRSGTEMSVRSDLDTTNQIRIEYTKQQLGSSAETEKIIFLIDEYYITEAPIQIPEDKGAVKSHLKIIPKSIKVLARDTILKY